MGDNEKGQKLMDIFRRIIGVVLIVIGAVVAAHMILEPLYHVSREASPNSPIWNIIDPFTALAVLLGVIFSYIRKRGVDHEGGASITREFLAANTAPNSKVADHFDTVSSTSATTFTRCWMVVPGPIRETRRDSRPDTEWPEYSPAHGALTMRARKSGLAP